MTMWLEAKRQCNLAPSDSSEHVIHWQFDMTVLSDDETSSEKVIVGRMLADELRRFEIAERGENVWNVADADSSGLEVAWSSLLDEQGEIRQEQFEGIADPVVYLYRFQLHPDFVDWRLAALDGFCRTFGSDAVILAQHHTTWLSEAEFQTLGFRLLPKTRLPAPPGFPNIDRSTRFMVRDNACQVSMEATDYPMDAPGGKSAHSDWLDQQGPWDDLV